MVLPQHVSHVKTGNSSGQILQTEHCGIAIRVGNGTPSTTPAAGSWISFVVAGTSPCVVVCVFTVVAESTRVDNKMALAKYYMCQQEHKIVPMLR